MGKQKNDDPLDLLKATQNDQQSKTEEPEDVCWFCGAEAPSENKKHWAGVQLEKTASASASREASRVLNVPVPRCETCRRIHMRMTWVLRVGLISFFVPLAIAAIGIFGSGFSSILPYFMYFGMAVLILGTLIYQITFPGNTHKLSYGNQYPGVLQAMSQGYRGFWERRLHR